MLNHAAIPVLPRARDLADRGCVTGASARNWAACCNSVELDSERFGDSERALLTDPLVNSIADADALIKELLAAEREALPACWF